MRVLRTESGVAGSPLLIQDSSGTRWAFCADEHEPRTFEWGAHPADTLARHLTAHGYLVLDSFIAGDAAEQLERHVHRLHDEGILRPGEIAGDQSTWRTSRGDMVTSMPSKDPRCPSLAQHVSAVDALCAALKPHVPELAAYSGRSQPMLAVYPGQSTSYPRHVDNPDGNGRILTCIIYLNSEWESGDGGELRLAPAWPADHARAAPFFDIAPLLNRLVLFWSDARMPHEVCPALKKRAAITLWLVDTTAAKEPRDSPLTSSRAACRLTTELIGNSFGLRSRLLGNSCREALWRTLPSRFAALKVVIDDPNGTTIGWLPSDEEHASKGLSLVAAARMMLRDLQHEINHLPASSMRQPMPIPPRWATELRPGMLLVQHSDGTASSSQLKLAELVPVGATLVLAYCLGLGKAPPASDQANSGLQLALEGGRVEVAPLQPKEYAHDLR